MLGWVIPPPKKPEKTQDDFLRERKEKVRWLIEHGFLRSKSIIKAMLKVRREQFIPEVYQDYAYLEVPLPIPGRESTISCPHSYPLFYEALGLKKNDSFLEVGAGSGYGAALAREIVGVSGKVVTVEIDDEAYEFASKNLRDLGYTDIILIHGDGSVGYSPEVPYDKICVTAACPKIPEPLTYQLKPLGKLVAPVGYLATQDLVLLEKESEKTWKTRIVEKVLYVPLRGKCGW